MGEDVEETQEHLVNPARGDAGEEQDAGEERTMPVSVCLTITSKIGV